MVLLEDTQTVFIIKLNHYDVIFKTTNDNATLEHVENALFWQFN